MHRLEAVSAEVAHWFVIRLDEQIFEGPLKLSVIKEGLDQRKFHWTDIAVCPGVSFAWIRLFEIKELVAFYPKFPETDLLKHFRNIAFTQEEYVSLFLEDAIAPGSAPIPLSSPPASGEAEENVWYLLIDDQECGPFQLSDLQTAFQKGKSTERTYAWRVGMKRWKKLEKIPELARYAGKLELELTSAGIAGRDKVERGRDFRGSSRKQIVASVSRISEKGIKQMLGVCADMALNGFRLQQDHYSVEYQVGTVHRLEIKPIRMSGLMPFQVQASVRWVDMQALSIGFQFEEMDPMDLKLLEKYLESQDRKRRLK